MSHSRIAFIFFWTLATLIGAGLGAALGWLLVTLYINSQTGRGAVELLSILLLMPAVGLGYGAGQALVLRGRVRRVGWWVPATMLGWLLGLSMQFSASQLGVQETWVGFGLAGLYVGVLQWLVLYFAGLKHRDLTSTVWIPASLAAWLIAAPVTGGLSAVFQGLESGLASTLTWLLAGLVTGLLTAAVMAWILDRQPA